MHQVCNVSAFRAKAQYSRFFKVYFKSFEAFWERKKGKPPCFYLSQSLQSVTVMEGVYMKQDEFLLEDHPFFRK